MCFPGTGGVTESAPMTVPPLREVIERNTRAFDDLIVALREIRMSQDRITRELVAEISDQRAEIRAQTARLEAHTRAIWKMLDRWGEGPTPAS